MQERSERFHRFLGFHEVRLRTGLSRSTIWRLERAHAFPTRRQVSINRVAWLEQEVDDWIRARSAASAGRQHG